MTSAPNAIEHDTRRERVPSLIEDGLTSLSYTSEGRGSPATRCTALPGFEATTWGTGAGRCSVPHEWEGNRP